MKKEFANGRCSNLTNRHRRMMSAVAGRCDVMLGAGGDKSAMLQYLAAG